MDQPLPDEQLRNLINVTHGLIDLRRAETQAHRILLRALLETHPHPDALRKAIDLNHEAWTAQVLSSEWPDYLIERVESELRFLLSGISISARN